MQLLHMVKQHLKVSGTSATRFGREAIGDPRLVHDLDHGRECRPATAAKVLAYIERNGVRRMADAHRELGRALIARGGAACIVTQDYRPWWSATFWGVRHSLTIEGDDIVLVNIENGLAEHEFDLSGHILIDVAVVERAWGHIMIEALTIENS